MTSNVILEQQLRLTFVALTEAQMLSIRSHYIGQQGRFLSFGIPDSLLSGMTTPAYFTPTGHSWIYGSPPQVEDIPGTQRYTASVELVTVPPEGANINGAEFTISIELVAGSAVVAANATGADLTVTASIEGGLVADNSSAGFELSVSLSILAGAADSGAVAGFGIAAVQFNLTATPTGTSLGTFALSTVNSSATLQLLITPVDFF